MFSKIDQTHLTRVLAARHAAGNLQPNTLPCHEYDDYLGVAVRDIVTGKVYKIAGFMRYWMEGWCIMARLEFQCDDGSVDHINVIWQKHMSLKLSHEDEMSGMFVADFDYH